MNSSALFKTQVKVPLYVCHINYFNIIVKVHKSKHDNSSRNQLRVPANIYYSHHRVDYTIKSVKLQRCIHVAVKFSVFIYFS